MLTRAKRALGFSLFLFQHEALPCFHCDNLLAFQINSLPLSVAGINTNLIRNKGKQRNVCDFRHCLLVGPGYYNSPNYCLSSTVPSSALKNTTGKQLQSVEIIPDVDLQITLSGLKIQHLKLKAKPLHGNCCRVFPCLITGLNRPCIRT